MMDAQRARGSMRRAYAAAALGILPARRAVPVLAGFVVGLAGLSAAGNADLGKAAFYTQTHTVRGYGLRNDLMRRKYLSGRAAALDGRNGTADFCIPGLAGGEHMIPQGIAFWEAEDRLLISAYDADRCSASLIFVMDGTTGVLDAVFRLQNADGTDFTGHVGGIAVSDYCLYVTTGKSSIGCIPLEELRGALDSISPDAAGADRVYILPIRRTRDLASCMNGTGTAYLSAADGVLFTGNFYKPDSKYDTKADPDGDVASIVLAIPLEGDSAEEEWAAIMREDLSFGRILLPDEISQVQDAVVRNGRICISTSYGRAADSIFYLAELEESAEDPSCSTLRSGSVEELAGMPMMEGICLGAPDTGKIYFVTESGSTRYQRRDGDSRVRGRYPTDTVWVMDLTEQ